MNPQDPLAQLRDIQLPATGGWWPPAPGWWLVTLLAIAAVAVLAWLWHRQRQKHRWKRSALQELQQLEHSARTSQEWFSALNALLKRVARRSYPDKHPEAMTGQQWINFLLETAPKDRIASRPVVEAMVASAWQPHPGAQTEQALNFARTWLEAQS